MSKINDIKDNWNGHTFNEVETFIKEKFSENEENLKNKEDILVDGETIKTINGISLKGSGNIEIPRGKDAVNPFKGWFDSLLDLQLKFPSPSAGDFAYIKGENQNVPSTIYECKVEGTWINSNRNVDTSGVQTFKSNEAVNEIGIDKTKLGNPADTDIPKAVDVMSLATKLAGVTLHENKIALVESGNEQNVFNGYIACKSVGSVIAKYYRYSDTKTIFIPCSGVKKIRFLGRNVNSNSYTSGYSFLSTDDLNNIIVSDGDSPRDISDYIVSINPWENTGENTLREFIIPVPEGAQLFCTVIISGEITSENFYCYAQTGKTVKEELDGKVERSDIAELVGWKKNLLNKEDVVINVWNVKSNKLMFEDGRTYTISNAAVYKDRNAILIRAYNSNDEEISSKNIYVPAVRDTSVEESNLQHWLNYGHGTFTYNSANYQGVAYFRIQLRMVDTGSYNSLFKDAQLELGSVVTDYVPYHSVRDYDIAKKTDVERSIKKIIGTFEENINNIKERLACTYLITVEKSGIVNKQYVKFINVYEIFSNSSKWLSYLYDYDPELDYYLDAIVPNSYTGNYMVFYLSEETVNGVYSGLYSQSEFLGKECRSTSSLNKWTNHKLTPPVGTKTILLNVFADHKTFWNLKTYLTEDFNFDTFVSEINSKATKRKMRVLAIGNSYTQDSLAYTPFILNNLVDDIDIEIGILMESSAGISDLILDFDHALANEKAVQIGETEPYSHVKAQGEDYRYDDGRSFHFWHYTQAAKDWKEEKNSDYNDYLWTMNSVLNLYEWDIILFNVTSVSSTWSDSIRQIAERIIDYVFYAVKLGELSTANTIANGNTTYNEGNILDENGNFIEEMDIDGSEILDTDANHYRYSIGFVKNVLEKSLFDFVIPVNTAVRNACTVDAIKRLGRYSENSSSNGIGYLRYDGKHLQEGLPRQLASLTSALKLLELYGYAYKSVLGDSTMFDSIADITSPNAHGTPLGFEDGTAKQNLLFIQKCAVMANKHPFKVTDMRYYYDEII